MADRTYTAIAAYNNANTNTNGANSITGAKHNTMNSYMIEGLAGKEFDATKPYKEGQVLIYEDATWGKEVWVAPADVGATAWNSASFTRLSKRGEKLTTNDETSYVGIDTGTNTYTHNIGHTDFTIQSFDSSGGLIPLDITSKTNAQFVINSSVAFASAVIYIQEIVIS